MAAAEGSKAYGQRMRKLEHAFQRTVKYSLRGVPNDEFYAYFPEEPLSDEIIDSTYDGYKQVRKIQTIYQWRNATFYTSPNCQLISDVFFHRRPSFRVCSKLEQPAK